MEIPMKNNDTMNIPDGKMCRDCRHFDHCEWLIMTRTGQETQCDWSPSRFVDKSETKSDVTIEN